VLSGVRYRKGGRVVVMRLEYRKELKMRILLILILVAVVATPLY
jgi:hypothetical protein